MAGCPTSNDVKKKASFSCFFLRQKDPFPAFTPRLAKSHLFKLSCHGRNWSCELNRRMGVEQVKVVEEVSGWLRVMSDGSVDRTWTGEEDISALTRVIPPCHSFVDGVATRDAAVGKQTGVWARIYLPQEEFDDLGKQKLAVVLHFHGGGFCISHANWRMYYQFYARLVKACNVICVSVNYRLAPEHRLPAAIEDSFGALAWLGSVAQGEAEDDWLSRRADFCRVFLAGDSVGGNVAHEVAALAGKTPLPALTLRGVVSIHPGYVTARRSKSEQQTPPDSSLLTVEMVDKFLKLALPEGSTKDHPITNPMAPAAPSLAELKLPPFLVAIADRDLIHDTQLEYCHAMRAAGHSVEVLISENVGHSFYLNEIAVKADPHIAQQTADLLVAIQRFIVSR